jgi:hypothetical protein
MKQHKTRIGVALLASLVAIPAYAKLTNEEAARLGKDLTPLGGEIAGNKEGTIPKYTGGLTTPPACFKPGVEYCDPFPGDKPKFTITAANVGQYKEQLPAGALAMFQKYSTFKMPVYETRRTAAVPKDIAETVKKEATQIELDGFGLTKRVNSTTPFPIPKNGLEAIWNHTLRYMGGGLVRPQVQVPVRPNGQYYLTITEEQRIFNQNMDKPQDNRLLFFKQKMLEPASLAGTVLLVHEPVEQAKEARSAWVYNTGQRRVKRAPDVAYDGVPDGSEGLRFHDQYDAYNGSPDRYDWKLVGKKEMYIPYNAYKIGEKSNKFDQILTKNHANPDLMRYELHRVWVVEATLKAGQRHNFSKRVFLLDEDSWNVVWEDGYDSRGDLWRVGIHGTVQFYDALTASARYNSYHDLNNGAYLMMGLDNDRKGTLLFNQKGKLADFQPDALRREGQ